MVKEGMVYIFKGILLSHKKEWNFIICNNMDGLGGHYAKWNLSEREKPVCITYTWNLECKTSEYNKNQIVSQI